MLHPLIYLSALSLLAGADEYRSFSASSVLDISSCPITFYGQTYEQIYVNFTSENVSVCFNDFYNPQTTGDCVVGPKAKIDFVYFTIIPSTPKEELNFISNVPTIKNPLQCSVGLGVDHSGTSTVLYLANFRTQTAVYLSTSFSDPVVFDAQVSGTTVDSWNVTGSTFAEISGCRYSGNVYKPGTSVLLSSSGTCLDVSCNETAVLSTQLLTGNSNCEIQYNDTADSTINCTTMTERYNLLKEAPFTTCNSLIDPQPYVTACTNTLCKYPAVDGLSCQFLKAYSRACNLQNNETVGDWWTKADC